MIPEQPTEIEVKALLNELPERTLEHEIRDVIYRTASMLMNPRRTTASALIAAGNELEKAMRDP